ncbi:MAG: GNAT family protein [Pseudomonadota bacterium]
MNTPFIAGQRLSLRGITHTDLQGSMSEWVNDREVTRYLFRGAYPCSPERLAQEHQMRLNDNTNLELAIISTPEEVHIGIVGLHAIHPIARAAELRVLIGDKTYWNRGYGTEATQLTLAYAFELLNLHKVYLGVNAAHVGAVRSYEKAGFVREGLLRDEIWRNGCYYDAIRMSILVSEYRQVRDTWPLADTIARQFSP